MSEQIVIRVDDKMKKQLQKLADADRRKLSDYVRLQLEFLIAEKNKK